MSVHIKEEVVDLEPVYIKTEVPELESDYIQEEVFEPEPVSVKTEIPAVEFAHMEGDRAVQFLSFNSCQHHILKESDSGSESVDFDVEQTEDDTPDEDEEDEVDDMEGQTDKSSQHWPSTKLKEFEWSLDPPVMEFSLPKIVGVKEGLSPQCSKLEKAEDFFKFLFDSTTVHTVVECTNKRIDREARVKHDSVMQHVTEHEVYAFIGVCILLGVLHKRNVDVHEIWSEKKGHLHRVHWATVAMSRQRFTLLSSLLTFDDIDTRASRCAQDPGFFKMQDIFERVRKKCCTAYQPGGHLTVDETLYPYRGKCSLRRHIPKKPPRYGLKLWEMVDVESGYLCNFNIYLGNKAGTTARDLRMTAALNLAKPFYNSGRNISTDKLFTSVELADKLWQQGLTLVGAIENREEILKKALLPSGRPAKSTDFYFASYRTLVSYVPEKQTTINLLSTMHHDKVVDTNTDRKKPLVLLYFSSTKGGCATFNKTVEEFSCRRTMRHWSLRLLQYLIDAMAANTFVLTRKAWGLQKMTQVFGTEKQHRRHFLEHLAQTLIRPLAEVRGKQMVQSALGFSRDYLGKKMARRELSEEAVANLLAESGSECDFVPDDSGSEYEPSGTSSSEETNSGQEEEPMETEPEPLHEPSTSRGPGLRDGRFQLPSGQLYRMWLAGGCAMEA
ncbi:piggyBac transposable element-derived protein 4-like isoform X2 [Acipenser ruthenus]|uniref:piggyBac transposable element-derived protein 4-like isoform X2 n=1 Tax=Acipenser ruthenus TaxID=7906 RepID=UPI002741108C|nr:piggyBac transposable element-derived protein 4-like isoform X2 [Acipenser ruthenus]